MTTNRKYKILNIDTTCQQIIEVSQNNDARGLHAIESQLIQSINGMVYSKDSFLPLIDENDLGELLLTLVKNNQFISMTRLVRAALCMSYQLSEFHPATIAFSKLIIWVEQNQNQINSLDGLFYYIHATACHLLGEEVLIYLISCNEFYVADWFLKHLNSPTENHLNKAISKIYEYCLIYFAELNRLPLLDPIKFLMIDYSEMKFAFTLMHNLFQRGARPFGDSLEIFSQFRPRLERSSDSYQSKRNQIFSELIQMNFNHLQASHSPENELNKLLQITERSRAPIQCLRACQFDNPSAMRNVIAAICLVDIMKKISGIQKRDHSHQKYMMIKLICFLMNAAQTAAEVDEIFHTIGNKAQHAPYLYERLGLFGRVKSNKKPSKLWMKLMMRAELKKTAFISKEPMQDKRQEIDLWLDAHYQRPSL